MNIDRIRFRQLLMNYRALSASVHEKNFKLGYCRSKTLKNRRTDEIDSCPDHTGQTGRCPGPF